MSDASQSPQARPLAVLVLAAGKGTRLAVGDNAPPKVLASCLGAPLIEHVRRAIAPLQATTTVVVTGHRADSHHIVTIAPDGYIEIRDRAKDVIKSGGEWISSIDLENAIIAHPAIAEAAVIEARVWHPNPRPPNSPCATC